MVRPLIFERPMTNAERVARHRAKKRALNPPTLAVLKARVAELEAEAAAQRTAWGSVEHVKRRLAALRRAQRAGGSEDAVVDLISDAVSFLFDYSTRVRAWHESGPVVTQELRHALIETINQNADEFYKLAQYVDGC